LLKLLSKIREQDTRIQHQAATLDFQTTTTLLIEKPFIAAAGTQPFIAELRLVWNFGIPGRIGPGAGGLLDALIAAGFPRVRTHQ
jgi:hypothetical protein